MNNQKKAALGKLCILFVCVIVWLFMAMYSFYSPYFSSLTRVYLILATVATSILFIIKFVEFFKIGKK